MTWKESFLGPKHEVTKLPVEGEGSITEFQPAGSKLEGIAQGWNETSQKGREEIFDGLTGEERLDLAKSVLPGEPPIPTEVLDQILDKVKRERLEGLTG